MLTNMSLRPILPSRQPHVQPSKRHVLRWWVGQPTHARFRRSTVRWISSGLTVPSAKCRSSRAGKFQNWCYRTSTSWRYYSRQAELINDCTVVLDGLIVVNTRLNPPAGLVRRDYSGRAKGSILDGDVILTIAQSAHPSCDERRRVLQRAELSRHEHLRRYWRTSLRHNKNTPPRRGRGIVPESRHRGVYRLSQRTSRACCLGASKSGFLMKCLR